MITSWSCLLPDGRKSDELLVTHGTGGDVRILVIPPLFAEHNAMRRQLALVMRLLGEANVQSLLPDLPGWNESLQPLEKQTLAHWRSTIEHFSDAHRVTHVLAVRSGGMLVSPQHRGWIYAPQSGEPLLRNLIRARIVANAEAGIKEASSELRALGLAQGLEFAGRTIAPELFAELENAKVPDHNGLAVIEHEMIGGPALWLRAEPGEDEEQVNSLVATILEDLAGSE